MSVQENICYLKTAKKISTKYSNINTTERFTAVFKPELGGETFTMTWFVDKLCDSNAFWIK